MSVIELTGRERARIIIRALEKQDADEIARTVRVPVEIVRELCRISGVKLTERRKEDDNR